MPNNYIQTTRNNLSSSKVPRNMKPTQILEKSTAPTESFHPEARGKTLSRKIVYTLIGSVVFVLVVGTVLLSVYFGMKMTKDNYKEYQATFVNDDGEIVNEKIIVTDREEVYSNDEGTAIADFSTGLLTLQPKNSSNVPIDECFVTNLISSDFQTPEEFTRTHETSQITFETDNKVTRSFEVTDVWLNYKALGPRSAKLCKGKTVRFLRSENDEKAREKRSLWCTIIFFGNIFYLYCFPTR